MKFKPIENINSGYPSSIFLIIIIILFGISNVSFSQGRRDRMNSNFNNNNNNVNSNDTSKGIGNDSLLAIDSTQLAPRDSTARIKYFKYIPEYIYGTKLTKKTSPLLLTGSDNIKYDISFDSSNNVIIREKFGDDDIRAPLVIPLEKYLSELSQSTQKNIFSQIVSEKFLGNTKDDISQLFEKFTDITIPLPFKSESIFGPPTFNLKINGAVDITASFQNSSSDQQTTTGLSNSNNSINFKQEVQLTAKGKVGDKLSIDADYNTQRLFDFENQLKIKYDGYADEVIKRIEGGNVSLQTNSGLIGSSQALFGVVGDFQLGGLSLSAVVSQKKSKTEIKDYSGGAQEQTFDIKVWDYSDNHYFLDTIYKASFIDYFRNVNISDSTNQRIIDPQSIEIWVRTDQSTTGYRKAAMHIDLGSLPASGRYPDSLKKVDNPVHGKNLYGLVRKLSESEYTLNKVAGYISLKISLPDDYFVGVAYKRVNGNQLQYGTISTETVSSEDTLVLKMIKVPSLQPTDTIGWELKLKNIYRLPVSNVAEDGFDLNVNFLSEGIYKPTLPIANLNSYLISIMGLDKYTNSKSGPPNNKFDFIPGFTIDRENGFIIFPKLRPFLDTLREFNDNGITIDASFWYPEIYTQKKDQSKLLPNANNYNISGKARGEAGISNTVNLGFNIVQGSVVVRIGNRILSANTDYVMDYSTGTLTIRNPEALISRDLKISYESNDLFSLASKTFMGLRGEYKISEKSSIGFTFVNLKQETLNDKVRLGEEPTNNSMFGVDFTTSVPSKMLTNLVNLLPGYNTKEPSSFSFRGEIAAINPDPNTKKSVIPQDNNEAVAYIDDMEGAKKVISLGTTYNQWTLASVPLDNSIGPTDSLKFKQRRRGKMKWLNITGVDVRDIYTNRDVQANQSTVTPLLLSYYPMKRGTYNYNAQFENLVNKDSSWNGIMKYLNTTSTDLISENVNFIEFSMQVNNYDSTSNGKLIIDLGNISKDAIPNDVLNTEDILGNNGLRSSPINDDLGIDYKTNQGEDSLFFLENGFFPPAGSDPALDDYDVQNNPNGTQNNYLGNAPGGNYPDTEDLNKTGTISNGNDYFQFEISLNPVNNPYIVGQGNLGWRQYKIPLSEYKKAFGQATFTNIGFARMWVTGVKDSVSLIMYDINLTGNQWVKQNKSDTTYNITVVSIEENSDYTSPIPGDVLRQTVRGQNNVNSKSNEQSLSLEVFNLTNGVRKSARKDYSSAPLDLLNYRSLKLFVNGDPSFNYINSNVYDAAMVVRIGNDSNNYYEYRAPIHPEASRPLPKDATWNTLNDVTINFNDLTKIKIARTDSSNIPYEEPDSTGPPGAYYKVLGNPDLQTVREITLGVEKNRNALNSAISGSIWFNELRLVNVIDNSGVAFTLSANAKLADLLDLNLTFAKTDPFFHGLDGRLGSRNTGISWDFSATLNAHKIINNIFASLLSEDWSNFITLPITFRHSENMVNPRYYPGTDIELEKAAQERYNKVLIQTNGNVELATIARDNLKKEAQTLSVRNSISISNLQFSLPSNNFLIKNIFNQLRFNFNTDFGNSRDLTYESRDDFRYNGGLSIGTDFGLADKLNLSIGKILPLGERYSNAKMYFFFPFIPLAPLFSTNFSASTDFSRSHAESKQRKLTTSDFTTRDFRANRGFRFDWKFLENWLIDIGGSYDFRAGSDLTPFETDSSRAQRTGGQIFDDIFFNNGVINFGRDLDYSQSVAINPKFNLPYIDRFLTFNGNYNARYGWVNPNQNVNIGYTTTSVNSIVGGANLKLNEIFSIFGGSEESKLNANGERSDTIKQDDGKKQSMSDIFKIFKTFIPNDINITYSQNNAVTNQGVSGLPGFGNFWFYPSAKENYGPSRMYQLGFSLFPGPRVANLTNIGDSYAHENELSFSTTINPVFPEAITMSLNFRTNWGFTNSISYTSDSSGSINTTSKSSSIASGHTMFFAGNIEKLTYDFIDGSPDNKRKLTEAFKNQISSFPFPNWNLNISGLEKFPFFSAFANSVTLENSFVSEYKESRLIAINSSDIPNAQYVTQAFTPFLGLNFNFKEFLGGSLTSTFRLNKSISHSLSPSSELVQTQNTNEWSINANFSKTGFSIPLFGLSLQNDITFALTVSRTTNLPINYEFGTGKIVNKPLNGSTVTTYNPTVQYSLSSKVSMQFFYKYIKTEPSGETVTTVPRKTNEGGLNIRISIQ